MPPAPQSREKDLYMQRQPVVSSQIQSIGFEDRVLEVEFTNGDVWQYSDVPEAVYQNILHAGSPGKQFNQLVKGSYIGEKV